MNPTEVMALPVGRELDKAVEEIVYGTPNTGAEPLDHSASEGLAIKLLHRLPLFISNTPRAKDPERPWVAGLLAHDAEAKREFTTLRVVGRTFPDTLCRAAIIVALKAQSAKQATQQAAGAVAASLAKKAAIQKAKRAAAMPVVDPTKHKGLKKRAKEQAKLARAAAPKSVKVVISPHPSVPGQPRAFLHRNFEPIPKRKEIVVPPLP